MNASREALCFYDGAMNGRLLCAFSFVCFHFPASFAVESSVELVPKSDQDAIIEVGYWRGERNGIGGHIWIPLNSFQLGDHRFTESKLDLNRFKIHLPYDLNELNNRVIDCDSDEFSFGPRGNLSIRSDEGEEALLLPAKIRFKRTGNQTFEMIMSGRFASHDLTHPFTIKSDLKLQFGYGAREPHPSEATIDKAIQLAGIPDLPRWCNETYEMSQDFKSLSQNFILLRLHRREDFRKWADELSRLEDISNLALPQFEVPDWWTSGMIQTGMTEDQETDVFYNEKLFTEDEEGNRRGFGMSIQIPGQPKEPSRIITGDLGTLLRRSSAAEFRHLTPSGTSTGWIALQPETDYGGDIFIFFTNAKVAETDAEHP